MVPARDPPFPAGSPPRFVPSSSRISLDDGRTPMWTSTRGLANLVGRCLTLRPAPSPHLSLSFSFCLFKRPSERSTSLPSPVGIENASPSRPLAAPLTAPFLVDLHASSPEARTWKIGRGRQYEATNEGNAASSVSVSLGEGVAAVGEQAERLETAPANFRPG